MHVHWHEGLFLLPHHLQWMQRDVQKQIRLSRSLLSPYAYGVVESKLSYDDLADGRIRFEKLRVIMPSGQEIWFPEDAQLPALDIKSQLTSSGGAIEACIAVPLWAKNRENSFDLGRPADPLVKLLYIPVEEREVADENTGKNPHSLHVRKINARVALKDQDLTDMEFLPIVRILRGTGDDAGKARPDPDFVPPCVLLRSSATLQDLMRDLAAQLSASREAFRIKLTSGGIGMEKKWEFTCKLGILSKYAASLPSIVEEGTISPFVLYLKLRELWGELSALNPEKAVFDCEPYNHLDPLRSLRQVDRKIRGEIIVSPGELWRVPFAGAPGLLRAALEPQHFQRPIGYYLGVKTTRDRTQLALYISNRDKFKLMPRSMEGVMVFGIELKEENAPPIDLPGESGLYYFRINLAGDQNQRRWEQIKQDGSASLVWNTSELDLSKATFTLFMILPSAGAS
jgi:type VI secretion system protein ImpJ